ncbi:hypothetical protein AWB75_04241 [Caballeronia catudaia]|uniref:Uncharacterized protein n=1 Tax=Caballeronia catudaia TaxID=1777136 RepID=A0A158BZG7_9BURK|nr:hypothetical protein [Caballeronia catudaia]SAK75370.1 hypothetical protein AWB75_04241 [Caballeronia catudaia]
MSRLSDRLGALKTARLPSMSTASTMMSRATIWLDGERARTLNSSPGLPIATPLSPSGDVAAALKAIEALAPRPARPGLHTLRVIVGAPFARYHALPWQPLPKPEDWVSVARMQAVQWGAGAEPWRYAVADGAWGRGRLAAAMPEALCAGIERLCKTRKLQLGGIVPGYTFALGQHARRIRDGAIAIAELEETAGAAALAHIGFRRGGGWTGFVALPVPGTLDDLWRDALALCAIDAPERHYVIGPGAADRWIADRSRTQWLAAPWDASS